MAIEDYIRTIPNYPKQGIMFRDITTLLKDAQGWADCVNALVEPFLERNIDKVAGIEARGFIFGGAIAQQLGVGFVPVRKKGKLPGETIGQDYQLEYGTDRVEIHTDAVTLGERILVVDDLLATGGTAMAAVALLREVGAQIVATAFAIDLPDLGGHQRLEDAGIEVLTLCSFDGD